MGNKVMGKFRKARHEGFQEDQITYLKDKWDLISVNDVIDVNKFADSYNITVPEAKKFVDFMDFDDTKTVNEYKFKVGSAILCQSPPEETAKLLFKMYDLDNDGIIGPNDMKIFTNSLMRGLAYYDEKPDPTAAQVTAKVASLMMKYDCKDKDGKLSLDEFMQMLKKDPEVTELLYEYGFITKAEQSLEETDYNDIDSDLEVEVERRTIQRDERIERIKSGIEHNESTGHDHEFGLEDQEVEIPCLWLPKVKGQSPSGYVAQPDEANPPNANLELEYVYGYRCHDTRNNLRYGDRGQLVYHTAGVGIVMDPKTMKQTHFQEHSDDITCLDIYDNMVLTGQHGLTPMLMIWDLNTLRLLCIWKDQLKNGIANCSFSNKGKMVVAVAMDDDHSIAIYDIDKGMAFRKNPKNTDFGLVATGKMTVKEVFDIKFQPGDESILAACMKEINIITWKNGAIISQRCIWLDQKPQAALTIGFINGYSVTGMFSGEFFVWKDDQFERNVKAHAQPVQALWTRTNGRGIISGTKRGVIMVWDQTLTRLYEFDSRDIGLALIYPPGPAITSVCESADGKILFGTRRSEIVEVQPFTTGQKISAKILMQGHFKGELWGLAVHPSNSSFYTVGEDEMLAQWDAQNKRIIRQIDTKHASRTCHVSPNAQYLAVGAINGRVFIYNPNSLKVITLISDFIDPDKDILSVVKFSPNSQILAVAYSLPFNLIVFYSQKTNWKSVGQIKDLPAKISCLDFSTDGMYIQASFVNSDILFYDVTKATILVSGQTILKDEKWATWTSIFGWSVQGIWPQCSSGTDINSCDRSNDGTILVTGDDFGKIKIFKYPCPIEGSGFGKFTGHSSFVQNVRFSFDNQYVISVGGDELSIFQWKYENQPHSLNIDHAAIADAQAQAEADSGTGEALFQDAQVDVGDTMLAVKPFYGEMMHSIPSWYKPNAKRDNVVPNGNLSVYHVMGFRYFYILDECRDMCAWTDTGTIAFAAAALGVEMDPKTQNQTFFNIHEEDIVSFALHPSKKFCATGQMAQAGKAKCIDIYVWDLEKKTAVAHFTEFHLRAIVFLKFSPDGTQLLSVGQDDDNSLAIHDWQANRMITTSTIDKAKVNCVAWKSETEFCTVGNKHIKFWTLNGRNVSGKMGTQEGIFESRFSVSYAFKNTICVSGGGGGNLFLAGGKAIPAHKGKVQSLKMDEVKNLLYSAGMDGKVIAWGYQGGNLVKNLEIVDLSKIAQFNAGITAMDIDPKTGAFLLGTCSAQIFSYDPQKKNTALILQGHFGQELWAACASPNSHKFVSAGADKTVRIWDIDTKKMLIASKPFDNDIRGVDWASNNKFIVCADLLGFIFLLDPNTLEVVDKGATHFTKMPKTQSTKWIEDIKISPDSKTCAFGAHGGISHVEVWEIHFPKFGKSKVINAGLTSALLHIDWSTDSSIALVNSEAYEMKFVDIHNGKNAISSACKDVEFATWTCKLGFPVQGIFPTPNYADLHAVCRSQSKKYLATGENSSKVVLFQYPVVVQKQKRKEYIGHSSHVTRVRFTFDDDFLISTGGNDKSIIVWKTDFGQEKAVISSQIVQGDGEDDIDVVAPKKVAAVVVHKKVKDPNEIFDLEEAGKGDQFMAVKPWMGAIKEPTPPFYNDKQQGFKPPQCQIALEYVYGYRSKDMRSNIYYLADDKILYNAAGLAIILDIQSNTQTFFDQHEDDITAIDINPVDRKTCATGEIGAKPSLFVWDSETKEVICKFKGVLTKGIISLSFSPSGKKLVGSAVDVDHYIAVFDVSKAPGAVIWTDKGGPDTIIDLRWNTEDSWATVGVKHFVLWTLNGKTIKQAKGAFGKACNKLSGIGVNGNDIVCGASDGGVQIWTGNNLSKELENHHKLSCDCIHISANYVLSGGRDGLIIIFDKTYSKITEINCKELFPTSVLAMIRAIYVHPTKQLIVVGTLGSEIYEISYNTVKITAATVFKINSEAMKGHYCPNLQWTNEVWGLDVDKTVPNLFSSCSDDGTFRVWNADERRQVSIGFCTKDQRGNPELPDHGTGDLQDKCKARSIAVALNGAGFVVGMKDGTMRIFDGKLVQTKVFKRAKEWVSEIKFSPDGTTMVYGSHDDTIYACKWPQLNPIGNAPMRKHSSYITHIDYSCDGVNLHSTCGAYELLFWDIAKGKQLPGGASALKDEAWHTWTVTLGWPVQGIWPECSNGTDINAIDRSNATIDGKSDPRTSYHLVTTGDGFSKVRILRYPSIRKSSESVEGRGHSSHVTKVRWNHDDTKIFSTGGEDQCVIQWKVTKGKL